LLINETTVPCTAADPDLFFPPSYGGTHKGLVRAAKALCAHCSVRRECLDRALTDKEEFGIWGGTTPWERSLLPSKGRERHR
jgi:WhiB family redox-sensing transcriptional regulator